MTNSKARFILETEVATEGSPNSFHAFSFPQISVVSTDDDLA